MIPSEADRLVLVGRVIATHGVQGEVKVQTESGEPERLVSMETVRVGAGPESAREFRVGSARVHILKRGKALLLRLDQVESLEAAGPLVGANVFVRQESLALEADEHFIHDLVGAAVVSEDGVELGTVSDILQSPAQDVLVIARPDAPEALVPLVREFVLHIDIDAARIVIRPIEGLLD